jgi:hypothetical protein
MVSTGGSGLPGTMPSFRSWAERCLNGQPCQGAFHLRLATRSSVQRCFLTWRHAARPFERFATTAAVPLLVATHGHDAQSEFATVWSPCTTRLSPFRRRRQARALRRINRAASGSHEVRSRLLIAGPGGVSPRVPWWLGRCPVGCSCCQDVQCAAGRPLCCSCKEGRGQAARCVITGPPYTFDATGRTLTPSEGVVLLLARRL